MLDGPMPQTKFVLSKALEAGLKPIVVVNKCDRPEADCPRVLGEMFDLLVDLGADDYALEFKVVYASGRDGWAALDIDRPLEDLRRGDLRPIFETIVREIPEPSGDADAPLQMLVTTLDYSEYVGRIGIGRVFAGVLRPGVPVALIKRTARPPGQALRCWASLGSRREVEEIAAGDLCRRRRRGDRHRRHHRRPATRDHCPVTIDEPTISMLFRINDSPFAGLEGQFVTSRQIRDRLSRELEHNVALRVEPGRTTDEFNVSGRGLLHLGILLETMRRGGFELSVARPQVILHEEGGVVTEPIETLVIDVPNENLGPVMELVGGRRGEMQKMEPRGTGASHLVFEIPSRSLIGLRGRIMTASQGEAIMHHRFSHFAPVAASGRPDQRCAHRDGGGSVTAHAVELLHERGFLFVRPGDRSTPARSSASTTATTTWSSTSRAKALTNMRASKEATVVLKPRLVARGLPRVRRGRRLVEITPTSVRMRTHPRRASAAARARARDRPRPQA